MVDIAFIELGDSLDSELELDDILRSDAEDEVEGVLERFFHGFLIFFVSSLIRAIGVETWENGEW